VKVKVTWQSAEGMVGLEDETKVQVTPALDDRHKAAALRIISTPDTLLSLAITGDQFTEGNNAIRAALASSVLNPHFAIIEAKRLLMRRPFKAKQGDEAQTVIRYTSLINNATVMSFDEIERLCDMHWNANQLLFLPIAPDKLGLVCKVFEQRVKTFLADGSIEAPRAKIVLDRLKKLAPNHEHGINV
jgi:hypothetical protein